MIEIAWADSLPNLIRWTFTAPWTWNEFHDARNQVDAMIDTVDGIVDGIIFTGSRPSIPEGAIANFRNLLANRHERQGVLVIVGRKLFISTILRQVLPRIPGTSGMFHYVNTEAQAYEMIQQIRADRDPKSA